MQTWRTVSGYEGLYEISNYGEIKSLPRKKFNGKIFVTTKERILKKTLGTTGYYKIDLTKNGKRKTHKIHRLVAKAFVLNLKNKPNVNHLDGDRLNNFYKNLSWCTQKENLNHAKVTGLIKNKLNTEDEKEIIKMYLSYEKGSEIAEKFNINKRTIRSVLKRNNIDTISMSERKIKYNINEEDLKEQLEVKKHKQIAEEYGCDVSLISHYKKRLKINGGIYKC